MVVIGVVLVVVVVGMLVVVMLVVVGMVLREWPIGSIVNIPVPLVGLGGSGIVRSPLRRTAWWVAGAGRGPGLTVTEVEGSHVPGSV